MENDIPGASLLRRKPEELKISEIKFWFKCFGDTGKGSKTKAELVKRQIALCILSGEVASAPCSCVAGKVGFCNHVLALMFKMCKYTLFSATTTKDLSKEQDQQSSVACISQLQQWHKKGGGKNIAPQPVMTVEVRKI